MPVVITAILLVPLFVLLELEGAKTWQIKLAILWAVSPAVIGTIINIANK